VAIQSMRALSFELWEPRDDGAEELVRAERGCTRAISPVISSIFSQGEELVFEGNPLWCHH
jgi:hypothetical protein